MDQTKEQIYEDALNDKEWDEWMKLNCEELKFSVDGKIWVVILIERSMIKEMKIKVIKLNAGDQSLSWMRWLGLQRV